MFWSFIYKTTAFWTPENSNFLKWFSKCKFLKRYICRLCVNYKDVNLSKQLFMRMRSIYVKMCVST